MTLTVWLWIAVFCGLIAAAIGNRKGIAGKAFLVGLLLGPIGVALAALDSGNPRHAAELEARQHIDAGEKQCPACYGWIDIRATKCPHCQSDLTAPLEAADADPNEPPAAAP